MRPHKRGANNSWRQRESNPRQPLEDDSTGSDTSHTEAVQIANNESPDNELASESPLEGRTHSEHIPYTVDATSCAPGVPEDNLAERNVIPTGVPQIVLDVIRAWNRLPVAPHGR